MNISFELNGSTFLDDNTFLVSCEWTKNYNEKGELMYCEVEAELHLDTRDEFISINFFDYNGEYALDNPVIISILYKHFKHHG